MWDDKEGWGLWQTDKRRHAPAEGDSSTQIQPKLAPWCQIIQFWKETGNLNFCGTDLEFEMLVTNLNIFKYCWPMACLVGFLLETLQLFQIFKKFSLTLRMELDETELAHRVPQSQSASPRLCRKPVGRRGGCSRLLCVKTLYGMWAGWSHHARCGHDCSQMRIKIILVEGEAGEVRSSRPTGDERN